MRTVAIFLTILIINQCFCDETVEINLKNGAVLGKIKKTIYKKRDYYSFRGIPFAETPTGELRFQPPKPHEGWEGKLEAFNNKPTCMQFSSRMRLHEPFGISGSEDCLYVNVFTPDVKGNAPVIVFDYNDSFRTWFNGTKTYSPDFFMEEGVIVVTISHRLAILGYLTTEDDVIKGNNGLRDFILGLKWVKSNIEKFGGNPSRVTLMGSRSGAAMADMLLYSKKAKGLFSAAILQSGTALETIYFYENPSKKAYELGKVLNITATDSKELLEGLQKLEAEQILLAEIGTLETKPVEKIYQTSSFPFSPVIEHDTEDAVLTTLPENGRIVNDVPIIIGYNSREGLDFISHLIINPHILADDAHKNILQLPLRLNFRFNRNSSIFKEANNEISEFYYKDKALYYGNILDHAAYIADVFQNYAIDLDANKLAESLKSPVFYYMFDFRGLLNENSEFLTYTGRINIQNYGATVLDELCYLMVCSRIKKTYIQLYNLPSEQNEMKVLKKMVRMWSNFARTGNPTPEKDEVLKGFTWKPLTSEAEADYLHITKALKMKKNPLGKRKQFWIDFLNKYSKMAVDGVVDDNPARDEL